MSGPVFLISTLETGPTAVAKRPRLQSSGRLSASPARPLLSSLDTQVIYCGDNLDKLRELPDGCVDLIYIDPPFNSNRNYEIFWPDANQTRSFEDRHKSTEAYISFMRMRCAELRRVLKDTGSFYYHCDWHASHYVKVMLDRIFGENNFQNEITWKRSTSPHNDSKRYGANHDTIFFYTKSGKWTWNPQYTNLKEEYIKSTFRYMESDGRRYRLQELTANKPGGDVSYEWKGVKPPPGRYWAYSKENMQKFEDSGLIYYSKTGFPRYKQYLENSKGVPLQTFWEDIPNAVGSERVGYPTQKPLVLLERIVKASSNPDDIVLDAFCGCGTALVAAQNFGRRWIGIDISPTACNVMADRLERDCGLVAGKDFTVVDERKDEEFLRRIPHFEFENWAILAIGGIPNAVKVNDWGIDGRIYPVGHMPSQSKADAGKFDFMDLWYPVQVKQVDQVGRQEIDLFSAAMERAGRSKGYFVSFGFSGPAFTETRRLREEAGRNIVPITVREILDKEDQLAMKLP